MTFIWFLLLPFLISLVLYPWSGMIGTLGSILVATFAYVQRDKLLFWLLKAKQEITLEKKYHPRLKYLSLRFGVAPMQLWQSQLIQTPVCFSTATHTVIIFNPLFIENISPEILSVWLITELNSIKTGVGENRFMLSFHRALTERASILEEPASHLLPRKLLPPIKSIIKLELNYLSYLLHHLFWGKEKVGRWKIANQSFSEEVRTWKNWIYQHQLDKKLDTDYLRMIDVQ